MASFMGIVKAWTNPSGGSTLWRVGAQGSTFTAELTAA